MIILAIETSCDDTCIAVLKIQDSTPHQKLRFGKGQGFKILSNIVSSQVKIHAKYGGVYPFLAKREHQKNLPKVFTKALKAANFKISNYKFLITKKNTNKKIPISEIDLIAVTVGPGLEPCLWTGVNFAKDLSKTWGKPIIPVNHIEAHILANFINLKSGILNLKSIFPAICLIVSGGHTQLILMKNFGKYKILGETRDDAAGECFDKTARILGLGYPGGPAIEAEATKLQTTNYKLQTKLPRPMIYQKNYDFSFSGLKTAVLYEVRKMMPEERKKKRFIQAMAKEIQQAIIDVLIAKTIRAAKEFKAKSIILGGGVVANNELRKQFQLKIENCKLKINFLVPPKNFCTDNAVMVAITGYYHWLRSKAKRWKEIKAEANLRLG